MFTISLEGKEYKFGFEYGRKKSGPNKGMLTGRTYAVVSEKIGEGTPESPKWKEVSRASARCDRRDIWSKNEGRKAALKNLLEKEWIRTKTFSFSESWGHKVIEGTKKLNTENRIFRGIIWEKYHQTVSKKNRV